jgi:hypothetical protein
MPYTVKQYGGKPRNKNFSPPTATRGGFNQAFAKKLDDPLTGLVQGQKAAKGEERLARSLNKSVKQGLVLQYFFRWTTLRRGTVNYKELDFLILTPSGVIAISVKGGFVHQSAASKEQDRLNELIILAQLHQQGLAADRVISINAEDLYNQAEADKIARRLGVYR